jgi:LacI family transcriptional regulator
LKRRLTEVPARKFGFLLQKRDAFYQVLGRELAEVTKSASYIEGKPIVEFMEEITPGFIVSKIKEVAPKVDALAVVAVDHPLVNEAIEAVVQSGTPVFSLLSDLSTPKKSGHVGLDGRKVGRIAAWTISRTARGPGKVGILLGSHRYLNQDLAEISFRSYMREHAPDFTLLEPIINLDDERIAYEAICDMVQNNSDLVAVYACGGGMDGLVKALREKRGDRRIVAVCNELTPMNRSGLIDGTVDLCLGHPVAPMVSQLVDMMAKACSAPEIPHFPPRLFSAEIYISENI